ncbi:MAG: SIS domain-containing protein [Candidatus Lokiarchaeota archaeon]|nr:SIS domain-containing protein [Candidatus Lokiarchaeota archaeon]
MENEKIIERLGKTLQEIAEKISINSNSLDSNVVLKLIEDILQIYDNNAMVFIYGAGRSGFIGRCFAQRLMHLGIKSCFISDAITHRYTERDLLILISGSGETTSPKSIANKAKEIGGRIALFTGNLKSNIAKISDTIIKIEGKSKDQAISQETLAPYTSLFDISTLAILDSIGGILMEILGVSEEDIDNRHASIE